MERLAVRLNAFTALCTFGSPFELHQFVFFVFGYIGASTEPKACGDGEPAERVSASYLLGVS
jgi:hypothetical protein